MRVTFERREELAPGIWEHLFKPESPVRFEPGQYVDFYLENIISDPRGASRTFTLTSLPKESHISFVTKDQRLVSPYKQKLKTIKVGETASITDPMGDLVLPKNPDIPLIFIAGGIGSCSFVSMLRLIQKNKETRNIQLHYGVRSDDELIYESLLNDFPFEKKKLYISPKRIQIKDLLKEALPDSLWYISGGQSFVEGLQKDLENAGISRQSIVFDYYDGYLEL